MSTGAVRARAGPRAVLGIGEVYKEINRKLTTMWACIFAAMVPFHAIAGTLDTKLGNIVFNWATPLALVYWGIKRSSAAGAGDAGTVQRVA